MSAKHPTFLLSDICSNNLHLVETELPGWTQNRIRIMPNNQHVLVPFLFIFDLYKCTVMHLVVQDHNDITDILSYTKAETATRSLLFLSTIKIKHTFCYPFYIKVNEETLEWLGKIFYFFVVHCLLVWNFEEKNRPQKPTETSDWRAHSLYVECHKW